MSDTDTTVKLILNDREISGWTHVRITRGIERLPNDFELGLTELYPGDADEVTAWPGDSCSIQIGDQTVITGYVDKFIPSYSAEGDEARHEIRIMGRGKCQDLVDCSAEWSTSQMTSTTADTIAANLAQAYGIDVSTPVDGDVLVMIPQFNIMLGETAFEVIDRVCKYSGLLAYEGVDGNLILSRVGTAEHASGLFEGQNVIASSVEYSMDQRYSQYIGWLTSMFRVGGDSFIPANISATGTDAGVPRNRKKFVLAEVVYGFKNLLDQRVNWEMNRRNGRSQVAHVTVDSWVDGSGTLWSPNKLVSVYLPRLKLADTNNQPVKWIIGEVSYVMDEHGTRAELTLMGPAAFDIQPMALNYGPVDAARYL